jgi:hypothetical protein
LGVLYTSYVESVPISISMPISKITGFIILLKSKTGL